MMDTKKLNKAKTSLRKERESAIVEAETELYQKSVALLSDAADFHQLDPSAETVPDAWVKTMGVEEATRRFLILRAAWQPTSKAPAGLLVAKHVVGAMSKARASVQRPRALNMTLIQIGSPPASYPVLDIVDSEDRR